jgi:two-component system cell cycle sensor histidine kinase PleC
MLNGALGKSKPGSKSDSLINDYSTLVGDAVLRHRGRIAEHKARLEIDLANKIKSEFISNMSHELRTPLNTVIGFSKLLSDHEQRKLDDKDIIQYSHLIHDAACHLLAAINDILDISKMQSGTLALEAREIGVDEVLHACLRSQKELADSAGVTLRHRIAFNLPRVRGDTAKLKQIFSNLISNAIKFTPKGGEVTVEAYEHGHGGVLISVRDTGIGMTDDEIRVALTLFGQVDGSRTRGKDGKGLGLPIAKALAELHGGELMVVSSKGKGTDVTVTLPPRNKRSLAEGRDALFGSGLAS